MISKGRWKTFAVLFGAFALLNFCIATANNGPVSGLLTASATLLGPLTGASARGFQSCCLNFTLKLLPFFLPCLALVILSQLGSCAAKSNHHLARAIAWNLGWLLWFAGGLVSFAHALG